MTDLLATAPFEALDPFDTLATDLDGTLVRPGDDGWDQARAAWHLDVDQRPAAVVVAASVRDVVATMVGPRARLPGRAPVDRSQRRPAR